MKQTRVLRLDQDWLVRGHLFPTTFEAVESKAQRREVELKFLH